MSNENTKFDQTNDSYNNDDFLKKYNEVFKNSFTAPQSETRISDKKETPQPKKAKIQRKHTDNKKEGKDRMPSSKNTFSGISKKLSSLFKRCKNKSSTVKKTIDIDIYSTDDIDLPLDLPKNLMDPESTEIQMTMFDDVEDSRTYQEMFNKKSEDTYNDTDTDADCENENQIRIEDLIKENILASQKADPYAGKIKYNADEPVENIVEQQSDNTDKFGDTIIFEPVKPTGFEHYKSVDEILREVNLPSDTDTSDDPQPPRRRRAGAGD